MEIRRFGVGHRRPQGPPGSVGLTGGPIHADEHGVISELVLARHGRVELHAAPGPAWLLVIEGGGWVQVGDERARVAAGEAVLWPAGVLHGLWTEGSELRAFVVEFGVGDDLGASGPERGSTLVTSPKAALARASGSSAPGRTEPGKSGGSEARPVGSTAPLRRLAGPPTMDGPRDGEPR